MGEHFARDLRGAMVERFAMAAGLVGIVALFLGSTVEQLASNGHFPVIAFLTPDQQVVPRAKSDGVVDAIDYTATGSIQGRLVLDPCTGRQK
jgi:hypothetical protein